MKVEMYKMEKGRISTTDLAVNNIGEALEIVRDKYKDKEVLIGVILGTSGYYTIAVGENLMDLENVKSWYIERIETICSYENIPCKDTPSGSYLKESVAGVYLDNKRWFDVNYINEENEVKNKSILASCEHGIKDILKDYKILSMREIHTDTERMFLAVYKLYANDIVYMKREKVLFAKNKDHATIKIYNKHKGDKIEIINIEELTQLD